MFCFAHYFTVYVLAQLTTEDDNRCFYVELNLTLIEFKQESCKEFLENNKDYDQGNCAEIGKPRTIECTGE